MKNVARIIILFPGITNSQAINRPANYSLPRILLSLNRSGSIPVYVLNHGTQYEKYGSIEFIPFSKRNFLKIALKGVLRTGTLIISQNHTYRRYALVLKRMLPRSRLLVRLGGVYFGKDFLRSLGFAALKRAHLRYLRSADMILSTADGTPVDLYMELVGVKPAKYKKWLNGFPAVQNTNNHCRRAQITCISRLSAEKGVDYVIKSFVLALPRLNERYKLTIIGDGPDRERLRSYAEHMGVSSQVEFLGESFEAAQHLYSSRLVLSGLANNPIMEAIATRTPVIAVELGETAALYGDFPDVHVVGYPPGGCGPVDKAHMETLARRTADKIVDVLNSESVPPSTHTDVRRPLYSWDERIKQELDLYESLF